MKKIILFLFVFLFFCSTVFAERPKQEVLCEGSTQNYSGFFPLGIDDRVSSFCSIKLEHGAELQVEVEDGFFKEKGDFDFDVSVYLYIPNVSKPKKLDCGRSIDKTLDFSSDPWDPFGLTGLSGALGFGDDFPYTAKCNSDITFWWDREEDLVVLNVGRPQLGKGVSIDVQLTEFFVKEYFADKFGIVIDEELDPRNEGYSFFILESKFDKTPFEVMELDSTFGVKLVLDSVDKPSFLGLDTGWLEMNFKLVNEEGKVLCDEISTLANYPIAQGKKCDSKGIALVAVSGKQYNPVKDKETKENKYYFDIEYKISDPELINSVEKCKEGTTKKCPFGDCQGIKKCVNGEWTDCIDDPDDDCPKTGNGNGNGNSNGNGNGTVSGDHFNLINGYILDKYRDEIFSGSNFNE